MKTKLTTYSVAAALEDLPNRILIAKWGENKNTNGALSMGKKTMTFAPTLAKARGHERIALDYQHNTVPGSPAFEKSEEPRKVAAYGTVELVEGEGAYLNIESYTPSGKENAREYSDISPAVELDEDGEILFFHSVALCRQGAVEGLEYQTFEVSYDAEEEEEEEAKPKEEKGKSAKGLEEIVLALEEKILALQKIVEESIAHTAPAIEQFTARLDAADKARSVDVLRGEAAAAGKVWIFTAKQERDLSVDTLRSILERSPRSVSTQAITRIEKITPREEDQQHGVDEKTAKRIRERATELRNANPALSYARAWEQAALEIES